MRANHTYEQWQGLIEPQRNGRGSDMQFCEQQGSMPASATS